MQTTRVYDDLGRLRYVLPQGGAMITIEHEPRYRSGIGIAIVGNKVTVREQSGRESIAHYDLWDRPVL